MELKDFVSETLKQIIDGVETAQAYAKEKHALINPEEIVIEHVEKVTTRGQYPRHGQLIWFDIAVSASEDKQAKGGAGVFVAPLSLGAQVQKDTANSTVSRIKFSVPLFLPQTPDDSDD